MKKTIILFLVLLCSVSIFSQQRSKNFFGWRLVKDNKKTELNELKVNLPTTIFLSYPEISYERIISPDMSFGASLGVGFDNERYPLNLAFIPYFRWFFGGNRKSMNMPAAGFFIEGNGALLSQVNTTNYYSVDEYIINETKTKSKFGAGLGIAIGWKYLTDSNWIGEVYGGCGRDFINNSNKEIYPRLGISIGKRF